MTEKAASSWLSSHHEVVPALEIYHRQALETLEDHTKTIRDLADIIALDPGMSISLYHEVNGGLQHGGKQQVVTVHSALSLLGDSAIADLVMHHKVLDQSHPDARRRQSYHQLMSRTFHMLAQLEQFITFQGIRAIFEIRSAALLHNIGEFCACLFDYEHYQQYQEKFRAIGSEANSAKPVFGFDFHELGRQYAAKSFLPVLVSESLDENIPAGRKARLIQLAADVSHQAEVGWYHPSMKATVEVCAAYLNQSLDGFDKQIWEVAINSARACPFDDVLPAAARLIMLPDQKKPAQPVLKVASETTASAHEFENRIQALLKTSQPTQAHLLDLLINHLHDDLHLSRVVLMMLSKDKTRLGARAGKGFDEHSPIRTLVIDITHKSLLKSLLEKQQALWIKTENYDEYVASLPAKFKASFLHENFFLMSMHVGAKPVGIIFCDRFNSVTKLEKLSYAKFKAAIVLTGEALSYLASHNLQSKT
jgi:hypothetical protein